ncbi:MAG: alanine:cation symporter family protein, partial [Pirellulales bacterium]|nr:alanine:cation symporter family protein [Pirellulales bacterium]
ADIKKAAADKNFDELAKLQEAKTTLQGEIDGFGKVFKPAFGIVLAIFVAIVIIGGIKRIAAAAEKVVPTMCGIYVLACLAIIVMNIGEVPELVASIFQEAFNPVAFGGGLLGVIVWGVQRAAFSNEAGVGSAAIAHSAAKTDEPVREGAVALLGPFIDTIVVCSMTALVVLITNAWDNDAWVVDQGLKGSALASKAFQDQLGGWFAIVFSIAVLLFAYSTIISWSYYGERCWERLFGQRSTVAYRVLAVVCVFVGAVVNLGAVLDFSDFMILAMAFPNILGHLFLVPAVRADLSDYWRRYKAGEFKTFK